jgi:hypothetical protein
MKSCYDALRGMVGCVVVCWNHVYALQEHTEKEFSLPAAAKGHQLVATFRHTHAFSLDQQSPASREVAPLVQNFVNILCK